MPDPVTASTGGLREAQRQRRAQTPVASQGSEEWAASKSGSFSWSPGAWHRNGWRLSQARTLDKSRYSLHPMLASDLHALRKDAWSSTTHLNQSSVFFILEIIESFQLIFDVTKVLSRGLIISIMCLWLACYHAIVLLFNSYPNINSVHFKS